jgi:fructose-1,6-bisphosphatase
MLIQVVRNNNYYDYIQDFMLDNLIAAHEIVKFKRGTGWVTIGTHPIRKSKREKTLKDNDRIVVNDDIFVREYRRAYNSSLEPF